MENMKKFGFTLAEVLITLGIIGVVAAMTIPTLIANTNSARFRSQYKKILSSLSQAGKIAQERYDFSYGDVSECTAISDAPESTYTLCAILNGTLAGHKLSFGMPENYTPSGIVEGTAPNGMPTADNAAHVLLSDGSMLVFNKNMKGCTIPLGRGVTYKEGETKNKSLGSQCYAFIDVNGPTLPNKEVACADGNTDDLDVAAECEVSSDFNRTTDIYPIVFHDGTVEPGTNAARAILQKTK